MDPVKHPAVALAEEQLAKNPQDFNYEVGEKKHVIQRHYTVRPNGKGDNCLVDTLFPFAIQGIRNLASSDETACSLLYGLVRAVQPKVVLETGTNAGRSAKAIVQALHDNSQVVLMDGTMEVTLNPPGHLWTVDVWSFFDMKLICTPAELPYVTAVVGKTPEVFEEAPLRDLQNIEFAYLDGDHTAAGLLADIAFVEAHRAPECWVAVDNTRDAGFPGIQRAMAEVKWPRISLPTACGTDLIWMH